MFVEAVTFSEALLIVQPGTGGCPGGKIKFVDDADTLVSLQHDA